MYIVNICIDLNEKHKKKYEVVYLRNEKTLTLVLLLYAIFNNEPKERTE